MKSLIKNIRVWSILILTLGLSCKKFIEVAAPVTSVNSENVYTNDNTAISVLTAIYAQMSGEREYGVISMSLFPELSADNLILNDITEPKYPPFYQNNLSSTILIAVPTYWTQFYSYIYQTNAAIEGLTSSNSLTISVKSQLLGEAQFMRAFCYFYLVNLYGDVPLVLSTNYKLNAKQSRTRKENVYQQIVLDLKAAQSLLNDNYMDVTLLKGTTERIRPNKAAATALLSRSYLYSGDFANAEIQASNLLDHNSNYNLVPLTDVFIKNSKETIWSLQPVTINFNTWESRVFKLPPTGPNLSFPFSLSNLLVGSFEKDDQRLVTWINYVDIAGVKYFYADKYKAGESATMVSEYAMVLRLAEQYLIRAEARAQLNKLTGQNSAISDLNAIRNRAGLLPSSATTKEGILTAILHERQTEFFTEWGHRWFDLKRTDKIDAVMTAAAPLKGGTWQTFKALYPIPQSDININPGMTGQQNPGYGN